MLVLTDTGDLEPELDISKKAVQSVGLRGKRFVQENLFAGSFLRYNEFWMRKTQGLFSLCKMKTGERWI